MAFSSNKVMPSKEDTKHVSVNKNNQKNDMNGAVKVNQSANFTDNFN
jgi:hypothetical protein